MLEHYLKGGPLMIPLTICSLVALAVVYDRWMAHRANKKIDTRALRAKVNALLRKNDLTGAIRECEASSGPIAAVLLSGLLSYQQLRDKGESPESMRLIVGEVMGERGAQAMSVVNKRLDILTTVANAAPLLGMTGTVTGMIASFAGLADAGGSAGGGAVVANGIAEALVTTAAGLLIALMAVIPQSMFNRWGDDIQLEIDEVAGEFAAFILSHH